MGISNKSRHLITPQLRIRGPAMDASRSRDKGPNGISGNMKEIKNHKANGESPATSRVPISETTATDTTDNSDRTNTNSSIATGETTINGSRADIGMHSTEVMATTAGRPTTVGNTTETSTATGATTATDTTAKILGNSSTLSNVENGNSRGGQPGYAGATEYPKSGFSEYLQPKLFSAIFKEATLDSPTFRAMIKYNDAQLMHTEKWVSAVSGMLHKIPPQVKSLESNLNELLEYLVPLVSQDPFIFANDEYSFAQIHTAKTELGKIWNLAIDMIRVLLPEAEMLKRAITPLMAEYRDTWTRFDKAQTTYDLFLAAFMATPKNKDAALVREDLAELHAARVKYINAALELLQLMVQLIDIMHAEVSLFTMAAWKKKIAAVSEKTVALELFHDAWTALKRICAFHEHSQRSAAQWKHDLDTARLEMQRDTAAEYAPSTREADYVLLAINFRALHDPTEKSISKQGTVFLKTWSERSAKPMWVKRWAFVDGGVFGMLVTSPAGNSVQETDKIGVLLCSTRYTPAEERRFCFELKTFDTTVVLQVETLAQLRLWLTVFDNARTRAHHSNARIASGRYPPLVKEFLAPATTALDRALTSAYVMTREHDMVSTSSLAGHLERNDKLIQRYVNPLLQHIALPIQTEATPRALLAYSLTGETAVPTALTANVWGSVNWGVRNLNDMTGTHAREPIPPADATHTLGDGITLPQNYPSRWIAKDVQMRAVFESALEPDECCLVLFVGLVLLAQGREHRGTIVATQHHVYTYTNTFGFVSLTKVPVEHFAEAECVERENFDVVKLVHMGGVVRVKMFLAPGRLVAAQLNCIFRNQALSAPVGVTKLIHQLVEEENKERSAAERKKDHRVRNRSESISTDIGISRKSIKPEAEKPLGDAAAIPDVLALPEWSKLHARFNSSHDFDLPPQAVLHMLFGSRSTLFDDANRAVSFGVSPAPPWTETASGSLHRLFVTDFIYFTGVASQVCTSHTIERRIPNEYYLVLVTRGPFKINYGPEFTIEIRVVITAVAGSRARLHLFLGLRYNASWYMHRTFDSLCHAMFTSHFHTLVSQINAAAHALGNGGIIGKSIYRFGKIPVTSEPSVKPLIPPATVTFPIITRLLVRLVMVWFLLWCFYIAVATKRAVSAVARPVSTYRLLCVAIGALAVSNVFLAASNSAHWWNARAASLLVRDALNYEPLAVEKAIYLKDMHSLVPRVAVLGLDSPCVRQFQNQSFVVNFDRPAAWHTLYGTTLRAEAGRLRLSLHDIGIKRNQLLVSLRMLNDLEEEVALGEWHNWLVSEISKCDAVLGSEVEDTDTVAELRDYCGVCLLELLALANKME